MSENPIISVGEGKLRGKIGEDRRGGTYFSFQGIPYAKPPLGPLRFKAPQPPEKWTGTLDATNEGSECYAKIFLQSDDTYEGTEDCLFLNVYTPKLPGNNIPKLKPVMVWIHGGGFTSGSSKTYLYGPEFLVAEDIVLVTINYRTGALGFLNFEDSTLGVPGNAGLKDMVLALKWVQNNIHSFGGDQKNVTIFGESAGGAATHYLMLSLLSKGLFYRVIAQSGCALNVWARGAVNNGRLLAKVMNIGGQSDKTILEKLRELSVEDLYREVAKLNDDFLIFDIRPFCPIVEKASAEPAFLVKEPNEILESGSYSKVPLMLGYASGEGMLLLGILKKEQFLHERTIIPNTFGLQENTIRSQEIVRKVKQFYFENEELNDTNMDKLQKLYADNYFLVEIYNTANKHLLSSHAPVYFYRFSLDTELNLLKKMFSITLPGTCHADDIFYLFKTVATPKIQPNSPEEVAINRCLKLWTNFAKFGNPTPTENDDLLNITWLPITNNSFTYLDIDEKLSIQANPEEEAIEFWNNLFQLNKLVSKF